MSTSWEYGDLSPARYLFEKKKKPAKCSHASKKQDVIHGVAEPPTKIMKDAKEICQEDAEQCKKKQEEKKRWDEAELNKAAETLDALIISDPPPPPAETVAWMPLGAELKELLESVPDLDELSSYEEIVEPLLLTQGSVVVATVASYRASTSLRT